MGMLGEFGQKTVEAVVKMKEEKLSLLVFGGKGKRLKPLGLTPGRPLLIIQLTRRRLITNPYATRTSIWWGVADRLYLFRLEWMWLYFRDIMVLTGLNL
mgnify:CR=1 FL=1